MTRHITTESGANYEVDGHKVRRAPEPDTPSAAKRGDGDWLPLKVLLPEHSLVGRRMFLFLEPLGAYGPDDEGNTSGGPTVRTTTPVIYDSFHPEDAVDNQAPEGITA